MGSVSVFKMSKKQGTKRLTKELTMFSKDPPPFISIAINNGDDLFTWHYLLQGPPNTAFAGGTYWGKIKFPNEYPFKPPKIMMCTPNGRFQTDTALCLSMSDFHPESWNPMWSVSTILTGVLSFMLEDIPTTGAVENPSPADQRRLAAGSMEANLKDPVFRKHFPDATSAPAEPAAANVTASNEPAANAAVTIDPAVAELKKSGNEAFKQKEWQAAVDAYTAALEIAGLDDPTAAILNSNTAACKLHLELPTEARQSALKAIELNPAYLKAHLRAMQACLELGDLPAARSHMLLFSTHAPDEQALLEQCEDSFAQAEAEGASLHPKKAAEHMAAVTALCKGSASLELRRAGWLMNSGDLLAAIESVNLAAKAGNRAGGLMLDEDGCWVAIGNKPEVLEEGLKTASSKRERGNHLFKQSRLNANEETQHVELAEKEYSDGVDAVGGQCAPLFCNRGTARLKLDRITEALADFEAALALDSGHAKAEQRRLECLMLLGEIDIPSLYA